MTTKYHSTSTVNLRFPIDAAATIAINAVSAAGGTSVRTVAFCLFDEKTAESWLKAAVAMADVVVDDIADGNSPGATVDGSKQPRSCVPP